MSIQELKNTEEVAHMSDRQILLGIFKYIYENFEKYYGSTKTSSTHYIAAPMLSK